MGLKPDEIRRSKDEATQPAKEVMEYLYQQMLVIPPFTLRDGTQAAVEAYYAPEVNNDEDLKCGVDVVLDNGTHLEFTVKNTGWGKSFATSLAGGPTKLRRQR